MHSQTQKLLNFPYIGTHNPYSLHFVTTYSYSITLANKNFTFSVTGMKTVNLYVSGCADNENDSENALALVSKLL